MTDRIPAVEQSVVEEVAPVTEIKTRQPRARKLDPEVQQVLSAVVAELGAQDKKWGKQNYPLQGGRFPSGSQAYYAKQARGWQAISDERGTQGLTGWDDVLIEETFEALAEVDPDRAIAELVQVAAVAVQAILSLQRNRRAA